MDLTPNLWHGKKVIVTGHTGFKGSWLTLILNRLGAKVYGISLPPAKPRSLYEDAQISKLLTQEFIQDIRDLNMLEKIYAEVAPDYIFHLAAQALVLESLKNPIETISTNVIGTSNILVTSLSQTSLAGIIISTTDKVYENMEIGKIFTEDDRLGGDDPYSSSKAATELVVRAISLSVNPNNIPVATVRAGNVIGGGDWGSYRLIPDLVRAFETNSALIIRNPLSTRPFQHVLDCLFGYILVAQSHLLKKHLKVFDMFNFGPDSSVTVTDLIDTFKRNLPNKIEITFIKSEFIEHINLNLNSTKAKEVLNWIPHFSPNEAIIDTAKWYSNYLGGESSLELMEVTLDNYLGKK